MLSDDAPLVDSIGNGVQLEDHSTSLRLPRIDGDEARFKKVLTNLLSNAVKYNREGGRVGLTRTIIEDARLRLTITDNGNGIPAELHSQIFTPFNRLGWESSAIEGTGIGLSLSRQLIEMMDGEIGFESAKGEGTSFWIEIDIDTDMPYEPEKLEDPGLDVDQSEKFGSHLDEDKSLILYVEDNLANLQLMEAIIDRFDRLDLISAETGEIGYELAVARKPQVIFMDINLPGINRVETFKLLQKNVETANIPAVALSADAMPADIKEAMVAGFKRYLTKPIQLPEVLQAIEDALSGNL